MNAPAIPQRNASSIQRDEGTQVDATTHLFAVGQLVRLKAGFMTSAVKSADIYRIIAKLPPKGNSPQYRIRNDDERHERMTTQDNLEPVSMVQSDDGATLTEMTSDNG
ncbi:hypothetical protein ACFQU1_12325 [Chelatococcus sp. GCM10030263]|uniref:hypothetical protein n=1 Tax=Chelatococcus sp. GCM10030263 TaxID=3273387 RepID=UPI0036081EB0